MLIIKPWSLFGCDEELGTICVLSSIGHAHPPSSEVLQFEILVLEFITIDTLS